MLDGVVTEGAASAAPSLVLFDPERTCWDTNENVLSNIKSALARGLPTFRALPFVRPEIAAIVASGPSIVHYMDDLRLLKERGNKIFAVNQTHDYLIHAGIVPDYFVAVDSAPELAEVIRPHKDVTYLVGSMCSPKVFDRLNGSNVVVWHAWNDLGLDAKELGIEYTMIGGGTAALHCPALGYELGHRNFEFYGVDSSYGAAGEYYGTWDRYSYKLEQRPLKVECCGRMFDTTVALAAQAQDFTRLFDIMGRTCDLQVHGDGLLPFMARQLNRRKRQILTEEAHGLPDAAR